MGSLFVYTEVVKRIIWWFSYSVPIISLVWTLYLIVFVRPELLNPNLILALLALILIAMHIRFFWKISVHAIVMTFLWVYLIKYFGSFYIWFGLLVFLVMWSRVLLKKHTWWQVIAGALLSGGIFAVMVR